MTPASRSQEHIQFVTGRLAQHALRDVVVPLAAKVGFDFTLEVLPITVAALMTPAWIRRHLRVSDHATRIVLPGYCRGELESLESLFDIPVEYGPRDLNQLPQYFLEEPIPADYGKFDIEILAEINHCPQRSLADIRTEAKQLARAGADWIDVGCDPGGPWMGVYDTVRALRDDGHRVSIDTFDIQEASEGIRAGAELVLSVSQTNLDAALDWGVEVVVVPDDPGTLRGLDRTVESFMQRDLPIRIDPILSPIGFGMGASLGRYLEIRRRYPNSEMLMGIGNLTELTEVDSAGINALLLGFCQELAIRSVLTTQVIPWAQSSVQECDLGRRMMYHSVINRVLPKHVDSRLVMLRDPVFLESSEDTLQELSESIRDQNYRIHVAQGKIHLIGKQLHLQGTDPMQLMQELQQIVRNEQSRTTLTPEHLFYLGYEMSKATTALTLGKNYVQDESLDWGMLTRPEVRHRLQSSPRNFPS